MTFGIKHILYIWLIIGRFIWEGRTPNLPLDLVYVVISLLMLRFGINLIALFAILVSVSTLYNDLILISNINTNNNIISALGALITFYIAFNPMNYGRSY